MQDYDLDKEEQDLLQAFENGEFVRVVSQEAEKAKAKAAAKATKSIIGR